MTARVALLGHGEPQSFADLVRTNDAEALGEYLASLADDLEAATLEHVADLEAQARATAEAVRVYTRQAEEAERAQELLDSFAMQARRQVGKRLRELDPGGKGKPKSERRKAAEAVGWTRDQADQAVKLAELDEGQVERVRDRCREKGWRLTPHTALKLAKTTSEAEDYDGDEWYTPPDFLALVRKCFGGVIDCDPTSCLLAQRHVQARAWHSLRSPLDEGEQAKARKVGMTRREIDAAVKSWKGIGDVEKTARGRRLTQAIAGSVFAQPPYSDPAPTLHSTMDAFDGGLAREVIALVNVGTATAVQQRALAASSARLWVGKSEENSKARMGFVAPSGEVKNANRYDQVAYYLGPSPATFAAIFGGWGTVKMDGVG